MFARATPRHPIHPVAALKRASKAKGYHHYYTPGFDGSNVRYFGTRTSPSKTASADARRVFASQTRVSGAIHRFAGRAPFASSLRPNLTGGTLNRTSGGYAFGAGGAGRSARYFSHTPAAPAQVVHNVSQAVRAFALSGKKAQFDGIDARSGEMRFKAVPAIQEETCRRIIGVSKLAPGSYAEFNIKPTVTGLSPLSSIERCSPFVSEQTLCSDGLLDVLSVDFSRTLKDLATVLNDLKKLSTVGDLPITYRQTSLRVHFPGCDYASVESLCMELGIKRAVIRQDEAFDEAMGTEIALLFPLAPATVPASATMKQRAPNYQSGLLDNIDEDVVDSNLPRSTLPDQIEWQNMVTAASAHENGETRAGAKVSEISVTGSIVEGAEDEERDAATTLLSFGLLSRSPSGYESIRSSELDDTPPLPRSELNRQARHGATGDAEAAATRPVSVSKAQTRNPDPKVMEYEGFEGIYRFIEQCDSAIRR